jgi:HEAT repeat protein/cyclophilin family peptidyl-prolyl cis-trans isomerase
VKRNVPALLAMLVCAACASKPPGAPPEVAPAAPSFEQKMSWILRLEDQRQLRDLANAPPPAGDLVALLKDREGRIRRRAALAIGRVHLPAGIVPLADLLTSETDPEVRQMAVFGLGLIGRQEATGVLRNALADSSPIVRGRAAEALGLIGDTGSAEAIGAMVAASVKAGAITNVFPDESGYPLAPEVEATRLGLYALTRLKAYDQLAAAVLDSSGAPVSQWWPVAYSLGRIKDPRAIPTLRRLVKGSSAYGRGFAARGLGAVKDRDSLDLLRTMTADVGHTPAQAVEAIRAMGEIGDPNALGPLIDVLKIRSIHPGIRAEAVTAIGKLKTPASVDVLLELVTDPSATVRAAAFGALVNADPERFMLSLSTLESDKQWKVRAAIARALSMVPAESSGTLLESMADDKEPRVIPAVLDALAEVKSPHAGSIALAKMSAEDPVIRAAAARALGALKPAGALEALTQAAQSVDKDGSYVARAAALSALVEFGRETAQPLLVAALADGDWAVRVHAADLLHKLDPSRDDAATIRPAPTRYDWSVYGSRDVQLPQYSTQIYIDTDKGTIQVELAMLDAPLAVRTISELARRGYFGNVAIHRVVPDFVVQDGDPRGDGEGGPGFTMRDELSERPYLRGTVGMALDWPDTGGSQFFITLSPQPHLDAKYTVIGEVVAGMDVADRLAEGDVIRGVRVWDGKQ